MPLTSIPVYVTGEVFNNVVKPLRLMPSPTTAIIAEINMPDHEAMACIS